MKFTIYIDGASRGNPGQSSCAAIIKDQKGNVVCSEGQFLGEVTNNHAEFCALKLALEKALEIGIKEAQIYSDSNLLVNQFNGIYKIKNQNLFNLMSEIRFLSGKFKSVKITHITRDLNTQADELANITLNLHGNKLNKKSNTELF
ncbi:MAG TPA: ribonuclease HI family protein [Elusimicrobiales bacterium]|nr:ribonuclease HI family protein [Elusimicrobiales bacterium]